MKMHAISGAEKIQAQRLCELATMVFRIAIGQHEKLNDSDYSNDFEVTESTLNVYLFGVAEVYDVSASEWPYKKIWFVEDAVLEISNQNSGLF